MGHDIVPIGNHKLNTSSLEKLAEDLSNRININIKYGYWGETEYFELLNEKGNDDLIILGEINKHKSFETYILVDEKYMIKKLYRKYGDKLFKIPKLLYYLKNKTSNEDIIIQIKKEIALPNFDLELINGNKYLNINKEHYSNNIPYFLRWFSFCDIFTENKISDKDFLNGLNNFRRE